MPRSCPLPFPATALRALITAVALCLAAGVSKGQDVGSVGNSGGTRTTVLPRGARQLDFGAELVIPASVSLLDSLGRRLPDSCFSFDILHNRLVINQSATNNRIAVRYRSLPASLSRRRALADPPAALAPGGIYGYTPPPAVDMRAAENPAASPQTMAAVAGTGGDVYGRLTKNGSVSRGVTLGAGGQATLTSGMNLQMSGQIAPDLWLAAALTDANIPIQPDGATSRLSDLDKVYIQAYNDRFDATLGDYQLRLAQGRFVAVDRKLQGAMVTLKPRVGTANDVKKGGMAYDGSASASVSKGQYHRVQLPVVEGNLGPYRLTGAQGEPNIVVVAGSERVFLDGEPLERGANAHYTMNYNAAEIAFTPRVAVANQSRVVVEFEYTSQAYARFVVSHASRWSGRRARLSAAVVSESDARNQPVDMEMRDEWRQALANAGDDQPDALVPNASLVPFDPEATLYALVDTVADGQAHSIYRYSVHPDSARYSVAFTYMGAGGGDYVLHQGLANGRVFRWVAPQNGAPQGDYAPMTLLKAPQSTQNATVGGEFDIGARATAYAEVAYSRADRNTFSAHGDADNHGMAAVAGIRLGSDTSRAAGRAEYELVGRRFRTLERHRGPEFERDWGLPADYTRHDQHRATLAARARLGAWGQAAYDGQALLLPGHLSAVRNEATAAAAGRHVEADARLRWRDAQGDSTRARLALLAARAGYKGARWAAGLQIETEENTATLNDSTLDPISARYRDLAAYARTQGTGRVKIDLKAGIRDDQRVSLGALVPCSRSKYVQSEGRLEVSPQHTWELMLNYKDYQVAQPPAGAPQWEGLRSDNVVSGRISNRLSALRRAVSSQLFYEVGAGLEAKREYAYMRTAMGEGGYIWRDLNGDGMRQNGEFEQAAVASEGDFVRYFVATGDYVSAYYSRLQETFALDLSRLRGSRRRALRWLSWISTQTNLQATQKVADGRVAVYANPFARVADDTLLVSGALALRSVLSLGRGHPRLGVDLAATRDASRNLMASGIEERSGQGWTATARWCPWPWVTLRNETQGGVAGYASQAFAGKDYDIASLSNQTQASAIVGVDLQLEATYKRSGRHNSLNGNQVKSNDLQLGARYVRARKGILGLTVGFVHNNLQGDAADPTNYELLQGLQPGRNYTWQLNAVVNVSDTFQVTATYHGRDAATIATIHTGSVSVKAYF